MVIELNEYCSDLILNRQISMLESYIYDEDILSEAMDFAYDMLTESSVLLEATTNRDMLSEFKKGVSEAKAFIKEGKAYLRKRNKKSAKKSFSQAISRLDDLEKYLVNIKDFKVGSSIIGSIAGFILSIGVYMISVFVLRNSTQKKLDDNLKDASSRTRDISGKINTVVANDLFDYVKKMKLLQNDLDDSWEQYESNKESITNKHNFKLLILAALHLAKEIRKIIEIRKSGLSHDIKQYNELRNTLIVCVRDMKKMLNAMCK